MTDRRGSRFAFEVLFLLALTVALTLANLRPLEIAGIMLVGWVIVAVLEWVAWREEPHYGSGLPPRYYVPQVSLPPAQPLEPVPGGYPGSRDEAPTWIASPALRAEMLGDWPVAAPPVETPPVSATATAKEPELDPDPWTRAEELPAAPLGELDPLPLERHAEHVAAVIEPLPALVPPPVSVPAAAKQVPEPQPTPAPREWALDLELARSLGNVARYNLDPLGDPQPRRRFGHGSALERDGIEVPARPQGVRELPGRTNRQD